MMCSNILLFSIGAVVFGSTLTQGQQIAYSYTNTYAPIWTDAGSGAQEDVSIWKPSSSMNGYFPLGDTAVDSHNRPMVGSLTVYACVSDALMPPKDFTEIWNDQGSGADHDVRVMRMNPPSGYTCLGHVAVVGYNNLPDKNQYRCIKTEYVISSGRYSMIWNDAGSGADNDVSLWANSATGSNVIDANTFTAVATHSSPSGNPSLLRKAQAQRMCPTGPVQIPGANPSAFQTPGKSASGMNVASFYTIPIITAIIATSQ